MTTRSAPAEPAAMARAAKPRPATSRADDAVPSAPRDEQPALTGGAGAAPPAAPTLDIAIPVYNEVRDLEPSVRRLDGFLAAFPFSARVTIVDNGSVDGTWGVAQRLRDELPRVDALRLEAKGRGRALRAAWRTSDAAVLAYMDVDLSTDLRALLPLVAPLVSGHSDVAIGSRLLPGSSVVRGRRREILSRTYNALLHLVLRTRFRDAQCGFKAVRAEVAERLLPQVRDEAWFFDTELLVLAERAGMRIHEVAVDWTDDPDSRVEIVPTVLSDLRGVARLRREMWRGHPAGRAANPARRVSSTRRQLAVFAAIGVASTAAYMALFLSLRTVISATAANALALCVTAVANTAANRRLTFGVRGRRGRAADQLTGMVGFGLALVITSGALAALGALDPTPRRVTLLSVLGISSALATAMRFVLLRAVVGRGPARAEVAVRGRAMEFPPLLTKFTGGSQQPARLRLHAEHMTRAADPPAAASQEPRP